MKTKCEELISEIKSGVQVKDACNNLGIRYAVIMRYMKKNPDLLAQYQREAQRARTRRSRKKKRKTGNLYASETARSTRQSMKPDDDAPAYPTLHIMQTFLVLNDRA